MAARLQSSSRQGLADVFILLKEPFDSETARKLNTEIFETIYYAALCASNDLAKAHGPYESYPGSPVSKGILQFDMWGVKPSPRWDWDGLRAKIAQHGVRNSLLLAPMPTASTAQILGNNECFEPYTSNLYSRRVLSGEFTVVNQHLLRDLMARGLWTPEIRNQIIAYNGSVQNIPEIPVDLKMLYRTSWEIKQRSLIDMAADRGAFIDQSQSFNVFVTDPNYGKLSSMHFYGWKKGVPPCRRRACSLPAPHLPAGAAPTRRPCPYATHAAHARACSATAAALVHPNAVAAVAVATQPLTSLAHSRALSRAAGLKTGMYYLRTKAAVDAIKFTVDQQALQRKSAADAKSEAGLAQLACSLENKDECLSCGA